MADGAVQPTGDDMDLLLTDEQRMLQDSAEKLVERHGGPARVRALRGKDDGFERETWRAVAEAGWPAILVPEEAGGLGLGMTELCLVLEAGGRGLMMTPVAAVATAAAAIAEADESAERDALLESVLAGENVILPAIQERAYGPGTPETAATADGTGYRLRGTKPFIPGAAGADGFLVHASSPQGDVLCHVARDVDGVFLSVAETMDAAGLGRLELSDVAIAEGQVIAGPNRAGQVVESLSDRMRISIGAELTGVMHQALEMTLEYIKIREQFDRPIGSFQALQHRAVNEFIHVELSRSFVFQVAGAMDGGRHEPAWAAAVKAQTSDAALSVTKAAIQLHGGIGFTDEHDAGLYYKRAAALSASFGNSAENRARYAELAGITARA